MALTEFALIARYFTWPGAERQGVGDDCALIDCGAHTLALTSDMLLEGVHFFPDADPQALGHKALAVNLSDLAAAGAWPRCFLLALGLPRADAQWLAAFRSGMLALAQEHGCALVGGDTTRSAPMHGAVTGALAISITAIGTVDPQRYRGRAGARPGDDIWVSGWLGEAALGVELRKGLRDLPQALRARCLQRLDRPTPRLALGQSLAGIATAAIDVSDGLLGDLGHVLERSAVAARVNWNAIPLAPAFAGLDAATQQRCVLAGGDDYELLFTAAPENRPRVLALSNSECPLTCIGSIEAGAGLQLIDGEGRPIATTLHAYDHFAPRH